MRLFSLLLCSLLLFPAIGFAQPGGGTGGSPPPTVTAQSMSFDTFFNALPHGVKLPFTDPVTDEVSWTEVLFTVTFVPTDPTDYYSEIAEIQNNFTINFCQNSELYAGQWNLFHSENIGGFAAEFESEEDGGVVTVTFNYLLPNDSRTLHHEIPESPGKLDMYVYMSYGGTMVGNLNAQLLDMDVISAEVDIYESCLEIDMEEVDISGYNTLNHNQRRLSVVRISSLPADFKLKRPGHASSDLDYYDDKYIRFILSRKVDVEVQVENPVGPPTTETVETYKVIEMTPPVSMEDIIDNNLLFGIGGEFNHLEIFDSPDAVHEYVIVAAMLTPTSGTPTTLGRVEFALNFDNGDVNIAYQTRVTNPDY